MDHGVAALGAERRQHDAGNHVVEGAGEFVRPQIRAGRPVDILGLAEAGAAAFGVGASGANAGDRGDHLQRAQDLGAGRLLRREDADHRGLQFGQGSLGAFQHVTQQAYFLFEFVFHRGPFGHGWGLPRLAKRPELEGSRGSGAHGRAFLV